LYPVFKEAMRFSEGPDSGEKKQDEQVPGYEPPRAPELHVRELDILLVLLRARKAIFGATMSGLAVGIAIAFLLKVTFTSTATILPPQSPQSTAAALVGQLSSLSGLGAGSGASSLLKNPADLYVGILESRTIADDVIDRFHLQSRWDLKRAEDSRKTLKKHVQFEAAKNGLIVITVKEHDAQLASDIANSFVEELYQMNSKLAMTEAAQRRVFFDRQLQEEKNALATAEEDLKATEEKTGMIELNGQASMAIRNIAQVRAQMADREVKLHAMRIYATDQNPEVAAQQSEISAIRQQLAILENDQKQTTIGDTAVPAGKVPGLGMEYVRKLREVKYHEAFFALLGKELEAARIDEAKSAPIIQVVDRAVPSDRKSGPPRMLIALGFAFLGFVLSSFWAFLSQAFVRMREHPESTAKLNQMERMLRWRA
jgi:tyrosine-protein kinase Etk/Wzc